MEWDVQLDADFAEWLAALDAELRREIVAHANLLESMGLSLADLMSVRWRIPNFRI